MKSRLVIRSLGILVLTGLMVDCSAPETHEYHQQTAVVPPATAANMLMLNDSQVRLANVTTQKATVKTIGQTIVLNARLAVDEERTGFITSRVSGRVDRLYIKETGRLLRAGDPFMEIYSEPLITQQREYLLALDQSVADGKSDARDMEFVKSARKKLIRYGLTEEQVDRLARTREVTDRVTFNAPTGGVISSMSVTEGQYVEEGAELYRVEDIRQLWVEAELFPGETNIVGAGDKVVVRIAGFEYTDVETRVTFISPEYRNNSQVTVMRATISNAQGTYRPGMPAQVLVTHSARRALALPVDAVIRDAKGSYVFVLTDNNTFERRTVALGLEDADRVEIISGLIEGETVVITGAYLLFSELVLRGGIAEETPHIH